MVVRVGQTLGGSLLSHVRSQTREIGSELDYLEKHSAIRPDGAWTELSEHGRGSQRAAWALFERLRSFGSFILGRDVPYRKEVFLSHAEAVASAISLDDARVRIAENSMNRFTDARASLQVMVQLLEELPQNRHDMLVVVPDTNILLHLAQRPDCLPGKLPWAALRGEWWWMLVVIVPQVVKELDRMKVAHRRTPLSKAAQDVIRYLNAMRQSPRTMPAIPVEDHVQMDFLLTEPGEADRSLFSWLDASLPDHRILLSALDAARRWPHDRVVLATHDLHMALLASYAEIETMGLEGL